MSLVGSCAWNFISYVTVLRVTLCENFSHADSHRFLCGAPSFPRHLHGLPCNPMQSHAETHIGFFNRIYSPIFDPVWGVSTNIDRPTRSPSWVPSRVISSYTVPYGFLYRSPYRNFRPTLPHIDPAWVSLTHIILHGLPCGFLCGEFYPIQSRMVSFMGHHAYNFSPRRLPENWSEKTWFSLKTLEFLWKFRLNLSYILHFSEFRFLFSLH